MLRPILLVQAALVLFATVNAVPVGLVARQQVAETQLQTVQTTQTNQGLMTQTCTITLTPITVNGNPAVQEVQTCTVSMGGGGGENSGNPSAPSSSTNTNTNSGGSSGGGGEAGVVNSVTSVPDSFTQTFSAETGTETSAPSGSSGTTTSAASASSSSAAAGGAAGVVNPVESVAASGLDSLSLAAPTGTATGISAGATAAAANAAVSTTAAAQAFALPGKKLQVLPIGLGVFAGISVIALIVVGFVTYERTKYRKAFRQRKLAEAGSAMGYGGMAQRT